jgi:ketosteroid isomerase-like protein
LRTFLEAYEEAAKSRDFDKVAPLVAEAAVFWSTHGSYVGKPAVGQAFEDQWIRMQDDEHTLSDIEWVVATYWTSACIYNFRSEGTVNGKRAVRKGRGTNVLKRIDGSWRIVHQHLS